MKLNGKEIKLASYCYEILNDEMILFNEDSKKIIILNCTAIIIWNEIVRNFEINQNVCTDDIADKLMQTYLMPETEKKCIYSDVEEIIERLFQSSLLENI